MPSMTSSPAVSPKRPTGHKDGPSTKAAAGLDKMPLDKSMTLDEKIAYALELAEGMARDSAKLKNRAVKLHEDAMKYHKEANEDRKKDMQNLLKIRDEIKEERVAWENVGVVMTTVAVASAARGSHPLPQKKYNRTYNHQ